jgi:hypothetical protein
MNKIKINRKNNGQESGAALVTVLMISVLLGIACIAMLSAVGANSRNSTDVLSETKAYYAAESGLQATINVLRGNTCPNPLFATPIGKCKSPPDTSKSDPENDISYTKAVDSLISNITGEESMNARLSRWITYNYPTSGTPDRVVIGQLPADYTPNSGAAYSVFVTDPDNTKDSTTFSTVGTPVSFPSADAANKITISFTNVTSCTISFINNTHCEPNANTPNPLLSTLQITTFGSGPTTPWTANILINYTITSPRKGTRTLRGTISKASSTEPVIVKFSNNTLMSSDVKLCQTATANPCTSFTKPLTLAAGVTTSVPIYMHTSAIDPYRLKVTSTGYGPNGATKQLEAIIENNFFDYSLTPTPFMLQGNGDGLVFNPGNSGAYSISGMDTASGISVPSIGVIDQIALNAVINGLPNNSSNITPPPAIITDVPDWLATPQKLDALVSRLRTTAQNSGRYYLNPTQNIEYVGDYANSTGITFCEGNCTVGVDGGGILVVTGKLINLGGWDFRGLIIVTGAEGWSRDGGGYGKIDGNVVIAPYAPANLVSNIFSLPPKYNVTGGGTSDTTFNIIELDQTLGTQAISSFMLGIAEK